MGRLCFWATLVWAIFAPGPFSYPSVFAYGPFWDGPFSFGMTWFLGRLHLKAMTALKFKKVQSQTLHNLNQRPVKMFTS